MLLTSGGRLACVSRLGPLSSLRSARAICAPNRFAVVAAAENNQNGGNGGLQQAVQQQAAKALAQFWSLRDLRIGQLRELSLEQLRKLPIPSALKGDPETLTPEEKASVEAEHRQNFEHKAAEAARNGSLGFGFSAGGLLFPYYIGVATQLADLGVITSETRVAGASAGSLIATCIHSGLSWEDITASCLVLAKDCRENGTRGRLRSVLKAFLDKLLPDDIHKRCSNRVFVAVTVAFPSPRGVLISEFESKDDLIGALLTSCHIPWWFDGTLFTSFRGKLSYDGGLTNFIPLPPPVDHGVRVTCFPAKQLSTVYDVEISPDTFEPCAYPLQQLLQWAFEPAEDKLLLEQIDNGRTDALAWATATGVLQVVKETNDQKLPDDGVELQPLQTGS